MENDIKQDKETHKLTVTEARKRSGSTAKPTDEAVERDVTKPTAVPTKMADK